MLWEVIQDCIALACLAVIAFVLIVAAGAFS